MDDEAADAAVRALDVLHACAGARSRREFADLALPKLHRLLHCDEISLADVSPTMRRAYWVSAFPTRPDEVPLALHTLRTRLGDHPWCVAYRARGATAPLRLSDVTTEHDLRRTPFYADFYRPRELAFADYAPIHFAADHLVVIGLGRRRRDFTDGEHRLFERLRTPLGDLWLAAQVRERAAGGDAAARLSVAERRVAELVTAGLGNREVAARLGVSVKAVEQHLTRIYRRLGVRSRLQLALALGRAA